MKKPSSLPIPRTSRIALHSTRLDPIISEDSEASRMESVVCERLTRAREADECEFSCIFLPALVGRS